MPAATASPPTSLAPPGPAPRVSVVVPVYEEEENLEPLVREIVAAFAAHDFELIVVDDGSHDASWPTLQRLAAAEPRLRALRHDRNHGQSAALATGFQAARGELLVTLDGDLQNDPADAPRLLAELDRGFDVVSGVRQRRQDSFVRRVSSRLANGVRRRVLHDGISDVGCSLKAYRTRVLKPLPPWNGMHRFLPALARMEGARITELPVGHRPRRFGKSKYGIGNRLWRGIADLFGVWWLQRRWIAVAAVEELPPWNPSPSSGSESASSARRSSSAASSSSGSPPSAPGAA